MKSIRSSRNERGIALMMCLFALLLLTTIGAGLMFMANTETSVNYNYRSSIEAYYSSKAGLEEGRERIRFGNAYSIAPPTIIPSTTNSGGIIYILNTPTTSDDPVKPWDATNRYFDDELCNEPFLSGTTSTLGFPLPVYGVPCGSTKAPPSGSYTTATSNDPGYNTASALGYKWVRITLKQNCTVFYGVDGYQGTNCTNTSTNKDVLVCADPNTMINASPLANPATLIYGAPREALLPAGATTCESATPPMRSVYLVTSLASSPRGARRMTQYEIASVTLPPLPAALTLVGAIPNPAPNTQINFPPSNAHQFSGNDHGTAGCTPGPAVPAVATTDATANLGVIASLSHPENYTGAGTAPSVQTLTLGSQFATVGALQQLVANITAGADQTFGNNPTIPNPNLGTDANPLVTVVNGDFAMGNGHGAGLLLVTGNFTTSGDPDFNGVILVIGKGYVEMSGSGNGSFNGGMFVANLYDGSNNLLPANSAPGSPTFKWNGGGTFNFNYSSCWINNLAARLPYKIIASREEMY